MGNILLALSALIPAIILCVYIYTKDKAEKEPVGLLVTLLICGALSCLPCIIGENILNSIIDTVFSPFFLEYEGNKYLVGIPYYLYHISTNFIGVALVEEGFKFLFLYLITSKNNNFNSLFDGMIYAIFVSLGFAGLENILYVFSGGWSVALLRAVTSIPGHMFFAVLMGYHYSWWNIYRKAKIVEKDLIQKGIISTYSSAFNTTKSLVLALIIPIIAHGAYDFCCNIDLTVSVILFLILLIFLYIHCFRKISRMSKMDALDMGVAINLVVEQHPEALEYFKRDNEEQERVVVEQDTALIE